MQENQRDDVIEIDLVEVIGLLAHKAWLIILVGILTAAIGFGLSAFVITPQYESTTAVYILNKQDSSQLSYSDTQLATQLTKDYEELITCRYVMEKVIEMCGIEDDYEDLCDRVTVENATDTRIISITVKDPNPAKAQYIADSVRDVASEHIKKVMDIEAVNVVDQANLPIEPAEPSILKWTAIGGICGVLLIIGILLVKYLMDDTIKTSDDVEKYLGWSTLALIPVMQNENEGKKKHRKKSEKRNSQPYEKARPIKEEAKADGVKAEENKTERNKTDKGIKSEKGIAEVDIKDIDKIDL